MRFLLCLFIIGALGQSNAGDLDSIFTIESGSKTASGKYALHVMIDGRASRFTVKPKGKHDWPPTFVENDKAHYGALSAFVGPHKRKKPNKHQNRSNGFCISLEGLKPYALRNDPKYKFFQSLFEGEAVFRYTLFFRII